MKIFVCEFVTGGGLYREPLPFSLAQEGEAMLRALLRDLAEIAGVELVTTRDARLPPLEMPVRVVRGAREEDVWRLWERCVREADALWPVAPESGGVLERVSRLAARHGKLLLGSAPSAVALAASKRATVAVLSGAGIASVPTFLPSAVPQDGCGPWVAKPDDGAGCADTRLFPDAASLHAWLRQGGRRDTHVVQPYLPGVPASLSMLCKDGSAFLLSCNRQRVEVHAGEFSYGGSVLNDMADLWPRFQEIAQAVARAIPELAGHVGVDVLVDGDRISVLEVNPRLTTSYAGLRDAIGCNPARLALDLLYNHAFRSQPAIARNIVEVTLNA